MLEGMRSSAGILAFLGLWEIGVVLVAVAPSSEAARWSGKLDESGRPCLDKYRQVGGHSACLSPSAYSVPIELTAKDIKLIVDTHNRYRSGVTPPATNMLKMSWDKEIALIAQAWAETCSLGHDEARQRDIPGRLSLGQNVGQGFHTWTEVIDAWFREARYFTYGSDDNVFEQTGHYTQGVWADTNKLGCGVSQCGNAVFYVCNYGPAGNIDPIKEPYKSGSFCSECPNTCEQNLCDCGDTVCENGGILVRETCQCDCRHHWSVGTQCKLNCSAIRGEPPYCGVAPFDREGCDLYENVPSDCPLTCRTCPYGDAWYREGSIPLPTPDFGDDHHHHHHHHHHNDDSGNDNDNGNDNGNGNDNDNDNDNDNGNDNDNDNHISDGSDRSKGSSLPWTYLPMVVSVAVGFRICCTL